ncbi:MAG: ArsR family transcriptional regulator [Solirubrobacterales bacterium]|nr:ArsR family transcriptional regulator [Solirubrobacterales bacterium]
MNKRKHTAALCLLVAGLSLTAFAGEASAGVTISPLPGTPTAMPKTQISFLGAPATALSSISVVGSSSGHHAGRLRSYSSSAGASFVPTKPFNPGERVSVHARLRSAAGRSTTLSSSFTVAQRASVALTEFPTTAGTPADVQSFQSEPKLHPPVVTVHQAAGATSAPGYVFAGPFIGPGQYGPMIFDSAGNLVWFHAVPDGEDAADFRTQSFHGKNALTWWQGHTLQFGYGLGVNVIANANYKAVAVVRAGNGLKADEHEFIVNDDGSAYVLAYSPVQTDLSSAGGPASGIALDGVIQRIDVHTGLVMWEWHSLGNISLDESYSKVPAVPTNPFDYFHINSLETDSHGNLLISARNTWGVYDISTASGLVMWRLGGKKSTFATGPGVSFAYQHNALWLPGGLISVFDDEGAPTVKAPSRGLVIKLDLKHKTATLSNQLVRTPALVTGSQGNLQALPGGGWMVGWGGLPNFTEFNAQGQVIYDAQLPRGEFSYRVYREPWAGQPTTPPAISARRAGGATSVYASWNGATTVASWQLLTGTSAGQLTAVSTTPRTGFETTIPAPTSAFVQVRALSPSGRVLATSKAVAPTVG